MGFRLVRLLAHRSTLNDAQQRSGQQCPKAIPSTFPKRYSRGEEKPRAIVSENIRKACCYEPGDHIKGEWNLS